MELDGTAAAFSLHALASWHFVFLSRLKPLLHLTPCPCRSGFGRDRKTARHWGCSERAEYRDTEHYRLTRAFLEQPQRMLEALLDDD